MSRPIRAIDVSGEPSSLVEPLLAAVDGGPVVWPFEVAGEMATTLAPADDDESDPTALIVSTSGSTGEPKHVLLPASALLAAAAAATEWIGGPGHWLLATPANYIGGIGVLLRGALSGTEVVVADRSRGFRTTEFTNAADKLLRLSGRHYSSLVPTQLQRLLGDPAAVAAAAELDGILIGGAPLHDDLHARALDAGLTVICAYGLSETAGGCVYDGLPLSDVRLRIDDAGCLQVFGPLLARGYLGRPDLTATTFVDGGVRTKDIARLDGGVLTVLGRADDMIITGGVKVAPVAVEHVLRSCAGVEQVCVLGVPDTEWGARVIAVVVAGDPNRPPSIETLRNTVRAELGAAATPRQVVLTDSLPLRGAGKIDRTAVLNSLSPFT